MFSLEFSVNVLVFAMAMLVAGLIGFGLRSRQLRKKQYKIVELRKEMVDNHAHILQLQKEYVDLQLKLNDPKTPVVDIHNATKEPGNQKLEVLDSAI
jgi:hypothetical protein